MTDQSTVALANNLILILISFYESDIATNYGDDTKRKYLKNTT